jgi:hypothetical protein
MEGQQGYGRETALPEHIELIGDAVGGQVMVQKAFGFCDELLESGAVCERKVKFVLEEFLDLLGRGKLFGRAR